MVSVKMALLAVALSFKNAIHRALRLLFKYKAATFLFEVSRKSSRKSRYKQIYEQAKAFSACICHNT